MKKFAIATLFAFASSAFAGTGTGVITSLTVQPQSSLIVLKTTNMTGSPTCAVWSNKFGTKINSTDEFKALSAALLAAKIAKTPVTITGTGSCVSGGATEDILTITINN